MNFDNLGLDELLMIFLNVKGIKGTTPCKIGKDIPDYFSLDTSIKSNNKNKPNYVSPTFDENAKKKFIASLNTYYNFDGNKFISSSKAKIQLTFPNENKISISQLLKTIYNKIKTRQLFYNNSEFSKKYALNAFAFRGSFDLQRNYYTTDLHSSRVSSKSDLERFIKILMLTDLNNFLNLNFRELQGEGTIRDTQFRINLRYFYETYIEDLEKINPYRYRQFILNENAILLKPLHKKNEDTGFLKRIRFYSSYIVGNNHLDKLDIHDLREKLNFTEKEQETTDKKRSNSAKDFAILYKPDYCASCHRVYKNKDRTFKMRNGKFWYFEMHHVISFANKKINTEDSDNYVKLCPVCHRALTPNRATEKLQKKIIKNILYENEDNFSTLHYVVNIQHALNSTENPIDFVFNKLK